MESNPLPIPLAHAALSLMPAAALSRVIEVVMRRVEGRHPKLFKNLAQLSPAQVHLVPTDLPHRFALTLGSAPVTFTLVAADQIEQPDATVSGRLEALIDMLEGRVDGDTLFFSRDIQITGDTSVIVGLRNTLDREEIDLFTEILSLCGPFAGPARMAIGFVERLAKKAREHLSSRADEKQCPTKETVL